MAGPPRARAGRFRDRARLGLRGGELGQPLLERVGPQAVGHEPRVVQQAAGLAPVRALAHVPQPALDEARAARRAPGAPIGRPARAPTRGRAAGRGSARWRAAGSRCRSGGRATSRGPSGRGARRRAGAPARRPRGSAASAATSPGGTRPSTRATSRSSAARISGRVRRSPSSTRRGVRSAPVGTGATAAARRCRGRPAGEPRPARRGDGHAVGLGQRGPGELQLDPPGLPAPFRRLDPIGERPAHDHERDGDDPAQPAEPADREHHEGGDPRADQPGAAHERRGRRGRRDPLGQGHGLLAGGWRDVDPTPGPRRGQRLVQPRSAAPWRPCRSPASSAAAETAVSAAEAASPAAWTKSPADAVGRQRDPRPRRTLRAARSARRAARSARSRARFDLGVLRGPRRRSGWQRRPRRRRSHGSGPGRGGGWGSSGGTWSRCGIPREGATAGPAARRAWHVRRGSRTMTPCPTDMPPSTRPGARSAPGLRRPAPARPTPA